jgi:DNA primase
MGPLPTLCFDGDTAGQKAAHRAIDTSLPHLEPGRSLQFAFLPDGRDPDDMVAGGEKDGLAKVLGEPVPLIDVLWARERDRHPLTTPEQRASLEARLMEAVQQIEHKSLKFHYISALRERLRTQGQAVRRQVRRPDASSWRARLDGRQAPRTRDAKPNAAAPTSSLLASQLVQPSAPCSAPREALLILAIARHPWLLDQHLEEIAGLHLDDEGCCRIRNAMLTMHQTEELLDNEKLLKHLSRDGFGAELERLARACAHNADMHFASGANKEQVLEGWQHVMMLHGKAGIPRSLREAESDYVSEPTNENFSKLRAVVQQVEIAAS